MVNVKRVLTGWYQFFLYNDQAELVSTVVWGELAEAPWKYVMTSDVRCQMSDVRKIEHEDPCKSALVYTRNSVYRLLGASNEYHLPVEAAKMLAQGQHPEEVTRWFRPLEKKQPVSPSEGTNPEALQPEGLRKD